MSDSAPPRWQTITGRVLSGLPSFAMILSGATKIAHADAVLKDWNAKFGYPLSAVTFIGVLELACIALYLVPRTRVLGAILVTGYLGGAVATHVRIGDPAALAPALLGVFVWGGLYFRDERIRALLPLAAPSGP